MKEFDRSDLAEALAARVVDFDPEEGATPRHTKGEIIELLGHLGEVLAEALAEHSRVEIHEIGVFKLDQREAREGVTPDGNAWQTPERKKVEFDAAPRLATAIQEITNTPIY